MDDSPGLWDLLDRLDAAADDSQAYHHDLCQQFDDENGPLPCSCGAPQLLIDTAEFVRGVVVQDAIEKATAAGAA